MTRELRLIYTTCLGGQEAAFEEWYKTVHLPDILSVEGFVSGQLLSLSGAGPPMQTDAGLVVGQYLAVYETNAVDTAIMDRLRTAAFAARGARFRRHAGRLASNVQAAHRPPSVDFTSLTRAPATRAARCAGLQFAR